MRILSSCIRKIHPFFITGFLLILFSNPVLSQQIPDDVLTAMESITIKDAQAELTFLASDWTEGRKVGTPGCDLAGDFLSMFFKLYGLKPFGDAGTYHKHFDFIEYKPDESMYLEVASGNNKTGVSVKTRYHYKVDFDVVEMFRKQESITVTAPVVFAGYGLKIDEIGYDDFEGIKVKDKIVLVFNGFPAMNDPESPVHKKFVEYYSNSYNGRYHRINVADIAAKKGALGVIFVNPPHTKLYPVTMESGPVPDSNERIQNLGWAVNAPWRNLPGLYRFYEGDTPFPRFSSTMTSNVVHEKAIPTVIATDRVAADILEFADFSLEDAQEKIDKTGKPAPAVFKSKMVTINKALKSKIKRAAHIMGYFEGSDPVLKHEIVLLNAHYDHMGKEGGFIFNGADDNASGTIGVLECAQAFSLLRKKPKRSVMFACWAGEEFGTLDPTFFIESKEKMTVHIMLDMIGRNKEDNPDYSNTLFLGVSPESPELNNIAERINKNIGLDLIFNDYEAYERRPFLHVNTRGHKDYHQPTDSVEKINFEKMKDISRLIFLIAWDIANREKEIPFDNSKPFKFKY